jgi:hypothetical protein
MIDARTGAVLGRLYPLDRAKNADGRRRTIQAPWMAPAMPAPEPGIAPLLKKLMAEHAATGLPPAYVPKPPASTDAEIEMQGDQP